jgi:hypothetical protein
VIPRVVDQHVETAPGALHARDRAVHVLGPRHVPGERERPAADAARRHLDRVGILVEQGHPRAVGGQAGGDGESDAAGGSGDERGLADGRHR